MIIFCYSNPEGEFPRYFQDIIDEHPDWAKGDALPEGWNEVFQEDNFVMPEPIIVTSKEGTSFPEEKELPENIRFAATCKKYTTEIIYDEDKGYWKVQAVLDPIEYEVDSIIPVEWFIDGEWTNEPEPEA